MKKLYLIILIMPFFWGISFSQNLIRVNNNPGIDADYSNLQDANDNASNGDTIYVEGSETDYEGADITQSVTIIGPGYFLRENPNTQANGFDAKFSGAINFKTGSAGSVITGCNSGSYSIYINVDDISVIRCHINYLFVAGNIRNILILQNYMDEINVHGDDHIITNSLISNNIIRQRIDLTSLNSSVQIVNNLFLDYGSWKTTINCYNSTIQNNISADTDSPLAEEGSRGNTIKNNILASDGTNSNGNIYNIDMSTIFIDFDGSLNYSTDAKWKLKEGSPAIGAGIDGVDCGAYGGVTPYVLSGLPDLPRIYEAEIPSSANSAEGLNVTIKVKSGQ